MTERNTEGPILPTSIRSTITQSEQNTMIASAYNIIGQKAEDDKSGDTERPKEKVKLSYEEKEPNNDIRALVRPK